jgi:hypothetical protein
MVETPNIFISWSGERSKVVAMFLREWLPLVIQSLRPWVSLRDLERGSIWFTEIADKLKNTNLGVVCLTRENKSNPWILFEAGALAKGLTASRVCTLLIDLQPTDVEDPLAQLNHTVPTREGMSGLMQTINKNLPPAIQLSNEILSEAFSTYWPKFEKVLADVQNSPAANAPKPRSSDAVLSEILENVRFVSASVRRLETSSASGIMDEIDEYLGQKITGPSSGVASVPRELTLSDLLRPIHPEESRSGLQITVGGKVYDGSSAPKPQD